MFSQGLRSQKLNSNGPNGPCVVVKWDGMDGMDGSSVFQSESSESSAKRVKGMFQVPGTHLGRLGRRHQFLVAVKPS